MVGESTSGELGKIDEKKRREWFSYMDIQVDIIRKTAKTNELLRIDNVEKEFLFGLVDLTDEKRAEGFEIGITTFLNQDSVKIIDDIYNGEGYNECPEFIMIMISMLSSSEGEADFQLYFTDLMAMSGLQPKDGGDMMAFVCSIYGQLFLKTNDLTKSMQFVEACKNLGIKKFELTQINSLGKITEVTETEEEKTGMEQYSDIDSDNYQTMINLISADVQRSDIACLRTDMMYDGFNPKTMRKKIAKRLDELMKDNTKSLYLLVATTIYRGTNISKIVDKTAKSNSLNLFSDLCRRLPIEPEKSKIKSESITLGRIVASYPDVAAFILKANGVDADDTIPKDLENCFRFSHAGSIIPDDKIETIKLWTEWSDAFSVKIKSKQDTETRKNFQKLILDSNLFSKAKRDLLYKGLMGK